MLLQRLLYLDYRRSLLSDGYVNTNAVLALLVDDSINCDSCLARLSVAYDQLSLAPADREHRVD